jgi:hypothetical protein
LGFFGLKTDHLATLFPSMHFRLIFRYSDHHGSLSEAGSVDMSKNTCGDDELGPIED